MKINKKKPSNAAAIYALSAMRTLFLARLLAAADDECPGSAVKACARRLASSSSAFAIIYPQFYQLLKLIADATPGAAAAKVQAMELKMDGTL
ncbi:hypothetical protein [Shewanella sp.]|uniref:hypothetical protein n=1 Tax=Shewanella sp. TaxID=50422 RepID=UPI003F38E3A4